MAILWLNLVLWSAVCALVVGCLYIHDALTDMPRSKRTRILALATFAVFASLIGITWWAMP